jgi:hypothetical protein
MKAARACQRLHLLQYDLGYRALVEAYVLRFGTLFHGGLEAWWAARSLEAAFGALKGESDPFDRVRAEELLRGYHYRWQDEPYETLAIELQFETELRNPATGAASRTWRLAGKIDAIVRDTRNDAILVVEHKTSSEDITQGSAYWKRLRMDGQVSVYFEGARSLGYDVSGCLYDVIGKPGLKPYKATPLEKRRIKKNGEPYADTRFEDETPEEFRARLNEDIAKDPAGYYQRGPVVRLESEMQEALFDIWQTAQQIRESQVAHRAPRNPDACERYGRLCPFFEVCSGAASLEDPTLFTRSDVVHPELAGNDGSKEETAQ